MATFQTTPAPAARREASNRAAVNQANAQHSTGPRTPAGKKRSSQNALRHGLTAASPVLPSEDRAAFEDHRRRFFDEYKPATPTETQFVQELADTSWRLNRIPLLEAQVEAELLARASDEEITFDIVDAHRLLANLTLQSSRLSRQFQKALTQLREIQTQRLEREHYDLKQAAALLEMHKHKGTPWKPSDHGFVFSKEDAERASHLIREISEASRFDRVIFHMNSLPRQMKAGL